MVHSEQSVEDEPARGDSAATAGGWPSDHLGAELILSVDRQLWPRVLRQDPHWFLMQHAPVPSAEQPARPLTVHEGWWRIVDEATLGLYLQAGALEPVTRELVAEFVRVVLDVGEQLTGTLPSRVTLTMPPVSGDGAPAPGQRRRATAGVLLSIEVDSVQVGSPSQGLWAVQRTIAGLLDEGDGTVLVSEGPSIVLETAPQSGAIATALAAAAVGVTQDGAAQIGCHLFFTGTERALTG